MAEYAIRVELQGYPTREQYEALHALMAQKGFYQSVNGSDGQGNPKTFNLPHAVYYGSSLSSISAVRDTVANTIKSTIQKNILVFVVQAQTWALGW